MSRGRRSDCSPCTAAFTMLIWFEEPSDLDSMSLMPAHSISARTAPPAMTPVPGAAGFSRTRPAPAWPITVCGIVVPIIGTSNIRRRASSTPLAIAAGTSLALP